MLNQGGEVGDARVAFEFGDHGLDTQQVIRELVEVVDALVEQRVSFEERTATGQVGFFEILVVAPQNLNQLLAGTAGRLWGRGVHDDQQCVFEIGKDRHEGIVVLTRR